MLSTASGQCDMRGGLRPAALLMAAIRGCSGAFVVVWLKDRRHLDFHCRGTGDGSLSVPVSALPR